ncbi:MAG: domain containing protein [Deltaproteobacteria bacterium]|nr:domain containing protein [Deltaproteobacteria bacterium]
MKGLKKLTIIMATMAVVALVAGTSFAIPVPNGDFELGNTGFTSAYTYHALAGTDPDSGYGPPTGLYDEKFYTVGTDPKLYHVSWASFGAHSGTQMMIVNGAPDTGVNVWTAPAIANSLAVTPGQTYIFSAWLASVYPQVGQSPIAPATLAFSINGTQLNGDFTLSALVGTWQQFSQPWVADATGWANLTLLNKNTAISGNDFALDDITLTPVPEPGTMLLLGAGMLGLAVFGKRRMRK